MPANQFFTDWVTGDIITADKLNTMKNEVQPYLGYTPLNKAGDTWTGDLIGGNLYVDRYLGIIGDIDQAKWFMHANYYSMIFYSDHNDSSYIPGADPTINRFGRTYRPKAAFRPEGHLDIAGEYRGRYDHQNRFVVQSYLSNNITIFGFSSIIIAITKISVPSGRLLYLRRVRWCFSNNNLRPRIGWGFMWMGSIWTGSSSIGDSQINGVFANFEASAVYLEIVNNASNNQTAFSGDGIWAELEIR